MSRPGDRQLYRELRDWRRNKTENFRLSETHDLFDRQLATRRKSHDKEVLELSQQLLGVKVKKPSPSVDEHLGKSYRRTENFRAAERAKFDRRYKAICGSNTRNFKKLHNSSNLPPEMLNQIISKPGSRSASGSARKKTVVKENETNVLDKADIPTAKNTEDKRERDYDDRNLSEPEKDDDENNEEKESGEVEEPPDWYIGRRRFTLAALNDLPSHLLESRRQSTGSLDLADILEVTKARNDVKNTKRETLHELNESTESDKEDNSDSEDDDAVNGGKEATADGDDDSVKSDNSAKELL